MGRGKYIDMHLVSKIHTTHTENDELQPSEKMKVKLGNIAVI